LADHRIPSHVSRPSRAWLEHLLDDYEWTPSEWRLCVLAAETHDRAATARRTLDREGLTVETARGGIRPHPCAIIARDATTLFSKLLAQLGIDQSDDDVEPGPKIDRRYSQHKHAPPQPGERARGRKG
jgi:hypothetical protein